MERIGVGFSGGMSPQDIVECVRVAEELGYESAWVAEGPGKGTWRGQRIGDGEL